MKKSYLRGMRVKLFFTIILIFISIITIIAAYNNTTKSAEMLYNEGDQFTGKHTGITYIKLEALEELDIVDEKLKNNLGLKFAFRSTDLNEIKKTLAFFGVDPEDENNQKRLRDLENGQCLISDLYGRVGVIQFHPVFEELLHAFDTRPPVRKEV